MSDVILDSQQYYHEVIFGSMSDKILTPVTYAESDIRRWLNTTFFNTAFNADCQRIIVTTEVDNSLESTGYVENSQICENTIDKVFFVELSRAHG